MLFPLSDDPDLFFKVVARLFLYDGAHLVTECQHISTGSAAKVYHKAAVLIADGCAAVAVAAQAALVDQRSRKSTRRALEGAAGAGLIQRLLFHTLGHQFIHFCTDVRCVSGLQMELCREDAAAVLFKNAVAIAEIQLCGRHFSDLAFCRQIPHCGEHVLHLAAVGTRIHIHCTAHRAGDAVGDPLQSFLPADVEMASRNQMRSALLPLRAIAAKQGCAVLIVMHSNKKQGVSGRARLADSSDIWDMARSVLMMGRAKNDGKIYLSHEKNSYARPQQTVLLHIDDVEVEGVKTARAVFDGYTDKKDADFIEERRVRTAETRQDTRSAILNVLSESRLGSMPSNELRAAVLREIGCSDSTYNRVYSDLTKSSQIAKQAIRGKDGRNRWYTCYCGETSDKVPF